MPKKAKNFLVDILFYIAGCFIYSLAVTLFISANEISPGGFTGLATLINHLFAVPTGFTVLILNIPILVLGFIKLGGTFVVKTAIATALLSVSLDVSGALFQGIITDKILAAIFGGMLAGFGLSLVFLRGATTGGVDIIAKLINRRFRHLTVGRLILIIDAVVIVLAAAVYRNADSAMYSAVAMYVSTTVTDAVLYGAERGKIVYAVTDCPDGIIKAVGERMSRGVTKIMAEGGFTRQPRVMLMCALRRHEVTALRNIIYEYDPKAFVVVTDAGEIIGEGFKAINN